VRENKGMQLMWQHDKEFFSIFGVHINKFAGRLTYMFGLPDFDIVKFDDYMHRSQGYQEEKDGSLKNFIQKKYGDRAAELIEELISLKP